MMILFSDLDGTLLDHDTYSYAEALPGIRMLAENNIPLIMVSSKTFEEMIGISRDMGLNTPFVFENGGGLALPVGDSYEYRLFGPGIEWLLKFIPLVEELAGSPVLPIMNMDDGDLSAMTGLPVSRAKLARMRKASIPFLLSGDKKITSGGLEALNRALVPNKVALTKGGRFFHLIPSDGGKGAALEEVIGLYRRAGEALITAAVGDNENDIPMLERVDHPFLVRKKDGSAIETMIAGLIVTDGKGPAGFSEAVEKLVKGASKKSGLSLFEK